MATDIFAMWTESTEAILRDLWMQEPRLSCRAIAVRLGGVSYSAIASKARRLGLPMRGGNPTPQRGKPVAGPRRRRRPPPPTPILIPVRTACCAWPMSEGRPWRFCEAPLAPGDTRYCKEHAARSRGVRPGTLVVAEP